MLHHRLPEFSLTRSAAHHRGGPQLRRDCSCTSRFRHPVQAAVAEAATRHGVNSTLQHARLQTAQHTVTVTFFCAARTSPLFGTATVRTALSVIACGRYRPAGAYEHSSSNEQSAQHRRCPHFGMTSLMYLESCHVATIRVHTTPMLFRTRCAECSNRDTEIAGAHDKARIANAQHLARRGEN